MYTHTSNSKDKEQQQQHRKQQRPSERPHVLLSAFECLRKGTLTCYLPDGVQRYYEGPEPGPSADLAIHDWRVLDRMIADNNIGFGEDYIRGLWDSSDLTDLLEVLIANSDVLESFIYGQGFYKRVSSFVKAKIRANTLKGSRRNIEYHYDLGNQFYSLWLDDTFTYSSALFENSDRSLEEAQQAKYGRILDRLRVKPGQHILEIGCGWGGFLEHAATFGDNFHVTGVTISREQYDFVVERLRNNGCNHASVRLQDYREVEEQFDHVVSIGMFEHVGEEFWSTYMRKVYQCLKPGGRAMIQSINIDSDLFDNYRRNKDFIREHIFPGGLMPSEQRFREEAEDAGLAVHEVFQFGRDYALTLNHWHRRFLAAQDQIMQLGFDEPFIRKWRFYLSGCEAVFRTGRISVMQVLLEKPTAGY